MLSPEINGKDTPDRPPGSPADDVAETVGMAFWEYCALSVVVSGRSVQSCVMSPIINELRMVIELLPNSCNKARNRNEFKQNDFVFI